jgi:hypothetical protein
MKSCLVSRPFRIKKEISGKLEPKGLRFFRDCAPKKWPLRGSYSRRLRWQSGYGYAAKACRTN